MSTTVYDYAIVGAGAAGLHLALAMLADPFFADKKILILEKDPKTTNDKTWCFWEKEAGQWDALATMIWDQGRFNTRALSVPLALQPYRYKMLRAIDFYRFATAQLQQAPNFTWLAAGVDALNDGIPVGVHTAQGTYYAHHVFDSRIDPAFYEAKDTSIRLLQHFKGWMVETAQDSFDTSEFTMMDFRVKWQDSTSFTYVLPLSPRKALVEFTLFTPTLITDADYDAMLSQYIGEVLHLKAYTVTETEYGIIPMSNYPFRQHHTAHITKIGTAGGWVKPSTGYSFKNAERFAQQIVRNIRQGKQPASGIATGRYRLYDTLFLDVLYKQNHLGERIFTEMYTRNPVQRIFGFLDETITPMQDLQTIYSFTSKPFLQAIGRQVAGR